MISRQFRCFCIFVAVYTDLKPQGEEDQTGSNEEETQFDTSEEEGDTEASEQSERDDQREGNEIISWEKKELTGRTDLDEIDDENVFRVAKQLVRKNRDVVGAGCVKVGLVRKIRKGS